MTPLARPIALTVVCALVSACSSPSPVPTDATVDAPADGPATDAVLRTDSPADTGPADVPMDTATDAGPADVPTDTGPSCAHPVEVLTLATTDWVLAAQSLQATASPCADYWISVPPTDADATHLRGATEAPHIRAVGLRMHAMAQFNWDAWAGLPSPDWNANGVSYRREIAATNYNPVDGDTWVVVNVPVTTLGTPAGRQALRDLVRGLYTGPMGAMPFAGGVVVTGPDQSATDVVAYRTALQNLLTDTAFWSDMATYVRWFGEAVPASPAAVCIPGTALADRATAINAYTQHLPRLAGAMGAPGTTDTALTYLDHAWVPMVSAQWDPASSTASAAGGFVATEVYATRAWADTHPFPGGRIGFLWSPPAMVTPADEGTVLAQMASSVRGGYNTGSPAATQACTPDPPAGCFCAVTTAAASPVWNGFDTW